MFTSVSMPQQDRTGEVVGERYRLVELLDSGGQGHVYRASDTHTNDVVAIKILKNELTKDAEWRERMFREARALTLLAGAATVQIHAQTVTNDGALCLVMEYLKGADLEDTLRRHEHEGVQFDPHRLVRMLNPIVRALALAHSHRILHRDVKPGNIFVLDDGGVRLLDFGFAKFLELQTMTRSGFVAGSPSYLAPEVWAGRSDLDCRIDVYGLGAVIFRALAGEPPFSGPLPTLLTQATTGPRPSLLKYRPDLPGGIDAWVAEALAIERDARFGSVDALWDAFLSLVGPG